MEVPLLYLDPAAHVAVVVAQLNHRVHPPGGASPLSPLGRRDALARQGQVNLRLLLGRE